MVFSSTVFLFLFFPLVLIGYYNPVFKSRKFKNIFLLAASLGFYAWGEPVFVFVMLFSIWLNWLIGLKIADAKNQKIRKTFMILAVSFNISLIFVFKYLTFVCENINLIAKTDFLSLNIALPIGISFFTFQIISYILDIYNKKATAQKNFLNTALYISLFPQLVAGPIVRYETIADEILNRKESVKDFVDGFSRFITGLAKKVLVANYAGFIADKVFTIGESGGMPPDLSIAVVWLGAICYTIQIYFDFSGYSDMAIGIGRMFGFHFPENFNYPYIAKSITEFWRRWHISLSSFFRDYLYIPLGGNRVSKKRLFLNLFIVWTLTGVWHGANWTFLAWGFFYFVLLAAEKFTGFDKRLGVFGHFYTMLFVIIGWVLFRSESILQAGYYFRVMFGFGANPLTDELFFYYFNACKIILFTGILFSLPVVPFIRNKLLANPKLYEILGSVRIAVLFVIAISVCVRATYNPFIYFNF